MFPFFTQKIPNAMIVKNATPRIMAIMKPVDEFPGIELDAARLPKFSQRCGNKNGWIEKSLYRISPLSIPLYPSFFDTFCWGL